MSELPGLSGRLHLVCSAKAERGTWVSRQSAAAPFHLSKTYWDGDVLLVNVINQTAGLFGGDFLVAQVVLEPGARVLLSSPSAARFHPSGGREVRLEQRFEVAAGAFLEVFPEVSIPQRNSRSFQRTVIDVQAGGEMLYLETLAPGRVAAGEQFAFAQYAWRTDARFDGRLVHRERAHLVPETSSLSGLRRFHPASYYAGFLLLSAASEAWDRSFQEEIAALPYPVTVQIGATRLAAGGWSVRLLAVEALSFRRAIAGTRELIYRWLGRPAPDPRRS